MALITILLCLGVQRYLNFSSYAFEIHWLPPYINWMRAKINYVAEGPGWISLAILLIPVLLILAIIFVLVYHLLGWFGYFILNLLFLWYCQDARDLKKGAYPEASASDLFVLNYLNVFAYIFWFAVFGPLGLALYYLVAKVCHEMEPRHNKGMEPMLDAFQKTQGALDWLPIRLLGLTFALVGNFSATFRLWRKDIFEGIHEGQQLVAEWGLAALQISEDQATKLSPIHETANLLDRSLLVWLVAVALFTIGLWLG